MIKILVWIFSDTLWHTFQLYSIFSSKWCQQQATVAKANDRFYSDNSLALFDSSRTKKSNKTKPLLWMIKIKLEIVLLSSMSLFYCLDSGWEESKRETESSLIWFVHRSINSTRNERENVANLMMLQGIWAFKISLFLIFLPVKVWLRSANSTVYLTKVPFKYFLFILKYFPTSLNHSVFNAIKITSQF